MTHPMRRAEHGLGLAAALLAALLLAGCSGKGVGDTVPGPPPALVQKNGPPPPAATGAATPPGPAGKKQ